MNFKLFYTEIRAAVLRLVTPAIPMAVAESPIRTLAWAGRRGLVVHIAYRDAKGELSEREIQPYGIRETRDGHFLLDARHAANPEEHRTFRLDRLVAARWTNKVFAPVMPVRL